MPQRELDLVVNGEHHHLEVAGNRTLLSVLRDDLNLTGTKEGCGAGECGACVVMVGSKLVNSCLILAHQANGQTILTVEGLKHNGQLHPLQTAFMEHGATQCGFCTPGLIMTAKAFLEECPNPTEEQVREAISGNLCRCTGYTKVVQAILAVARNAASMAEASEGA